VSARLASWRNLLVRPLLVALILGTTAWMVTTFLHVLSVDMLSVLDVVHAVIFGLLSLWLAQSLWSHVFGAVRMAFRRRTHDRDLPPTGRIALVMPIYNEEPSAVFARIAAMWGDLQATRHGLRFDIHILSDTTDPEIWLNEQAAADCLRRTLPGGDRLFYRRRRQNDRRKVGNIDAFLDQHGAVYAYMVVVDADSLMSGDTLVALAQRMDADPQLGILQVPPVLVNGETWFARHLQFSGELAGGLSAAGIAAWSGSSGNFWGHNAIIRVAAFKQHCALPKLRGPKPFGGDILSHDFVEAAYMRRAGYAVRIADDLDGSFEEPPPTPHTYLQRDRRWCQGNLQHMAVLGQSGLTPTSRAHLLIGIMSYLTAPLWLAFILMAAVQGTILAERGIVYFLPGQLAPMLPASIASEAMQLLGVTLVCLFLPKVIGLSIRLFGRSRRALGGAWRLIVGTVIETLASALLAPIMMLYQTRFVISLLAGRTIDWRPQERSSDEPSLRAIWSATWPIVGTGLLGLGLTLWLMPAIAWWLSPVLLGLTGAPLWLWLMASPRRGRWLQRRKLLMSREEANMPSVLRRYHDCKRLFEERSLAERFADLVWNHELRERHFVSLTGRLTGCDRTIALKAARVGPDALSPAEIKEVAECPETLRRVAEEAEHFWPPEWQPPTSPVRLRTVA